MSGESYQKLPSEPTEEAHEEEIEKQPWLRLCGMLVSCGLASGLCPGAPVWISLMANHGVFSHICDANDSPCDAQYITLGMIFTIAKMSSIALVIVAGLLFDTYGGRTLGTCGGAIVLVGYALLQVCLLGASHGFDSVTAYLLPPMVLIIDAGAVCNSQSVLAILFHFPNIAGVIIALISATMDIAALLPIMMEYLMNFLGLSLSACIALWSIGIALATFFFWLSCPTQNEYLEQAEKVMGQKIDSRSVSVGKVFYDGNRLLYENFYEHLFCFVSLSLGGVWQTIYCTDISDYSKRLFNDPSAAGDSANIMVVLVALNGLFAVPGATLMAEKVGMRSLVLSCVLANSLASATVLQADRTMQLVTMCCVVYMPAVGQVFLSLRAMAYAPANKFGTIMGLQALYFSILAIVLTTAAQIWMASLPDPNTRFETTFTYLAALSIGTYWMYFVGFCFAGLPSSPVLLPEEVDHICILYGCKALEDIAYILHFESEGNTSEFRGRISTNAQDVHDRLVLSIDRERMAQKMYQLSAEDFGRAMKSGFEWRRDLTKVDMNQNVFNIATMRNVLTRVADLSKFGKGSAKTVDQFESEVAKGRSKLVEGSDGKMTRLVNLVALRIHSKATASKKMLVQVAEKFADGRERPKLQFPGTKMGPDDSLEMCVKKICIKIGMAENTATFSYDDAEVSQQKLESPSYPGVFTVYNKTTVTGYVSTVDLDALRALGLPACQPFTIENEESKMIYMFEWMEEEEVRQKLSALEENLNESSVAEKKKKKQKGGYWEQAAEAVAARGTLRSVADIMWSLQVRQLTKRLVFFFQTGDRQGFEQWLLTEPLDNVRNALKDAADWVQFDGDKVLKHFREMISQDDLIATLDKRVELQPVIVDLFLSDLERVQQKLQKNSNKSLCENGHPLWECFQKNAWTCDRCGESFQDKKQGMHLRCNRCKIDICKCCSEKDGQQGRRLSLVGLLTS